MMLKKHWKLLLYAIFLCAALAAAYLTFFAMGTSTAITVRYDNSFSTETKNELNELIVQAIKDRADAHTIFLMTKSFIPAINLVTINRLKSGHTRVIVKSERPWILVKCVPSDNFILSSNGTYTPLRQYTKQTIAGLPHIVVTSEKFSTDDESLLYYWAQHLPDNFFAQYRVTWHKKTKLNIRDKNNPRLRMIATSETRFTPRLLSDLEKIREKIALKKGTKNWQADMRFRDQIVLAPIKTGKKEKGRS